VKDLQESFLFGKVGVTGDTLQSTFAIILGSETRLNLSSKRLRSKEVKTASTGNFQESYWGWSSILEIQAQANILNVFFLLHLSSSFSFVFHLSSFFFFFLFPFCSP
jgi:hypothetical protein